ncbi:hypothetical protein TNCV_2662771 [Trichonephila clavipes]|nr:hypothetical protein TNCV_2662771 [Trichonephila clavipes]
MSEISASQLSVVAQPVWWLCPSACNRVGSNPDSSSCASAREPDEQGQAHPGIHKRKIWTATAGSDVVQSGRPIFDDFFQHLGPYIGNNTANVVFQMVKRLWLIPIDQ